MKDYPLIAATMISFIVTVAFLLALRPFAVTVGLVDRPGGRKLHVGDVPIIGGIAMFIGIIAGFVVLGAANSVTFGLAFSFFLLVVIGALDDKYAVAAFVRVMVQTAAVLIITFGTNLYLQSIGDPFGLGAINLGPFALAGTVAVALTVINAYNLVDGVDGLAGVLALIALIAVSTVGGVDSISCAIALIVAGSTVGFLVFNFPVTANRPVRTFMGDAGSTMLGFSVFWATLAVSQGEGAAISPVVGLWFASIPVYDSLTCLVCRVISGKSPFKPGRDHFHHTLLRGGFGVRQKLGILGGLQALYAGFAVVSYKFGMPDFALFGIWCGLGLTQRLVINAVSRRHRLYLIRMLRAGELGPYRAARVRALR